MSFRISLFLSLDEAALRGIRDLDAAVGAEVDGGSLILRPSFSLLSHSRKIDKTILPILAWVYFLQILDKSVLVRRTSSVRCPSRGVGFHPKR